MKRKNDENFGTFKIRRLMANMMAKTRWRTGKRLNVDSRGMTKPWRPNKPRPLRDPDYVKPVSPATGKRHKGETLLQFKLRRRFCNNRRRERERRAA